MTNDELPERIWITKESVIGWSREGLREEGDVEYVRALPNGDEEQVARQIVVKSWERNNPMFNPSVGDIKKRLVDRITFALRQRRGAVTDGRKVWGELWLDDDGTANFKFHIEGGGFLPAQDTLKKFIELLQERYNNAERCPYYETPIDPYTRGVQDETPCKLGEPLMHGPQPYRWCETHNRLMMACDRARVRMGHPTEAAPTVSDLMSSEEESICRDQDHIAAGYAKGIEDAEKVVDRIYGCSDHDQPSHCADCALRHKAKVAIRALVPVPTPEEKKD